MLRTFEKLAGVVIRVDPSVDGQVTMELKDVKWDHALDLILASNGLAWRMDGDVIEVFPAGTG